MSISLIAVFIPILLMGGVVGRLFQEFAVTIAVAIVISLAISLTTTPMMSAYLLRRQPARRSDDGTAEASSERSGAATAAASIGRCDMADWSCWCWPARCA